MDVTNNTWAFSQMDAEQTNFSLVSTARLMKLQLQIYMTRATSGISNVLTANMAAKSGCVTAFSKLNTLRVQCCLKFQPLKDCFII